MSITFRVTTNTISPGLQKAIRRVKNPTPILRVMGVALQSYAVDSFTDPSKRMAPWAPKHTGEPSNLTETTSLRRSIRITALTSSHVDVGTDRRYGAIHQFGGKARPMPKRPFLPMDHAGKMHAPAQKRVERAAQKKLDSLLGNL